MNPRTTGILLVVALLLGGVVWLSNRHETERQEAEEQAKRLFGDLAAEDVAWIELRTSDGRDARLERADGAWRLVQPLAFPADPAAADGLASALAGLTSETTLEDAQGPAVYGLDDAAKRVRFAAGETEHELRVGKKTPIGANEYATVDENPEVYTVASFRVTSFDKSLDDLRERRPVRFDRDGIERIEVAWPDGGVTLERRGEEWQLVAPLEARADADTVETLLSDLVFLRANGFDDAPGPDAETGLDAPAWRVVLTGGAPAEGGDPVRHELAFGAAVGENERLARGAESALYRVPGDRFDKLPRTVVDFRWKELARFVASDARRFELAYLDPSAAGSTQVVTIMGTGDDEGWTTAPDPMAEGLASRMVAELSNLEASDIAAEQAGEAERAGLGLAPARTTLRVFGAAPADGGEAPVLADLRIGVQEGDRIYAQVAGRDTLYTLPASFGEHVPISLEAFRNRFEAKPPPEEPPAAPEAEAAQGGAPEAPAPPEAPPGEAP